MEQCRDQYSTSRFFSIISLSSWLIAQLPQIYKNYKNKSTEGISSLFLTLLFLGDFLSFLSCLINDVLYFQVFLSFFFVGVDIALLLQKKMFYRDCDSGSDIDVRDIISVYDSTSIGSEDSQIRTDGAIGRSVKSNVIKSASMGLLLQSALSHAHPILGINVLGSSTTFGEHKRELEYLTSDQIGRFFAWSCAIIYIFSRIPQILKNFERKSVNGISPILFGAALCGNLSYTLSLLTSCEFFMSKESFLMKQLPYIIGSSGTVMFDIIYFYQRFKYGTVYNPEFSYN